MHNSLKKISLLVALGIILPAFVFAAGNDVTLTTDANILVGGYTLNVSGSSAVVQSITVNTSNFAVTLASGSSITVSSPTLNQLSTDVQSDVTSNVCTGSASTLSLSYSGGGTVTNTITPSATVCANSTSSSPPPAESSGESVSVSGGSVSPSVLATLLAPGASTTAYLNSLNTPSVSNCPAGLTCTPSTAPVVSGPSSLYSRNLQVGDSGSDVTALQKFLVSKGLLNMPGGIAYGLYGLLTRTAVESYQRTKGISLTGIAGPLTEAAIMADTGGAVGAPTASAPLVLTHDLHIGDTGSDVSAAQTFLVEKGFLVIPTGNVKGLFGSLTEAAVMKYQKAHHISQTGIVGPKTRAAIMAGA